MGCGAYKRRLAYSVTEFQHKTTLYYFQKFITKVLEYKAGLNRRIKFPCVAMCSLVMSLCSHDLLVTLFSGLTCTQHLVFRC